MTDLTAQTPVEIDTALAALYEAEQMIRQDSARAADRVLNQAKIRLSTEKPYRHDERAEGTMADALTICEQQAASTRWGHEYAQRALDAYKTAKAALSVNLAEQEPLEAEYVRRGRWTRAFLVLASNGHVHRDRACSTCFITTSYGWLPSLSGHTEAEIVDAAGADACTVCYPSAPVESLSRPRRVLHHTEEEANAARAAREQAKADRAAKAAAKAIANPDGSPLSVFDWHVGERQGRRGEIIPAHDRYETLSTAHAAKGWLTDSQDGYGRDKRPEDVQRVALALAVKNGTTPEQEIEAAKVRARKRR